MAHANSYVPWAKADAFLRETISKENRHFRPSYKKLNAVERQRAIASLQHSIRPRPAFGEDPLSTTFSHMCQETGAAGFMAGSVSAGESREPAMARDCGSPKARMRVRLTGLSERAELNGTVGEVMDDMPDSAGRFTVRLPTAGGNGGSSKLMRISANRLTFAKASESSMGRSQSAAELSPSYWEKEQVHPMQCGRRGFTRRPTGGFYNSSLGYAPRYC
mmetsp:Transcript_55759/g.178939  ORF Transcript_55759/g.178939 Transcript_55759/m.178939 type:complete len:219 (-) Transcript_55759:156-812(-)